MSRKLLRRAGAVAVAVVAGVLGAAGPVRAGVVLDPPSAAQGSAQKVVFRVTNTGTAPVSRIRLVLPADTPFAEAYPFTAAGWATGMTSVALPPGGPAERATGTITWSGVRGTVLATGATADLGVALAPLPATSAVTFRLEATYANGRPGPVLAPVTLALTPAEPGQAEGLHGAHGTQTVVAAPLAEPGGTGLWAYAGWIVALAGLAVVAVLMWRGRRRPAGKPEAAEKPEAKEKVEAGAPRVTAWSYRDGPGD